jgi:hypothetical protein
VDVDSYTASSPNTHAHQHRVIPPIRTRILAHVVVPEGGGAVAADQALTLHLSGETAHEPAEGIVANYADLSSAVPTCGCGGWGE